MRRGIFILAWTCIVALLLSPFGRAFEEQVPISPYSRSALLYHAGDGDHNSSEHHTVSTALFSELEELARIVDITYCIGLTGLGISKPFNCLSRCVDFPRFELVTTWSTGPLLSDSCGYVALDHGKRRIVVAFRGTYSISNTLIDLSTIPQKYEPYPGAGDGDEEPKCGNCTVHLGFHTSWLITRRVIVDQLEEQVHLFPQYKLHLVGHSLGGAVAALAALDFHARGWDPVTTTFGEPRIGNHALVEYIDRRFDLKRQVPEDDTLMRYRRVTHVDDPIPLLPPTEWGFIMHAGEIHISKLDLSPNIEDLRWCQGDVDPGCIAGQDSTLTEDAKSPRKRDLRQSIQQEVQSVAREPWVIPSRYKLWQLFFSHRDYFWRLGLCVPGGDPLGGGSKYDFSREDL